MNEKNAQANHVAAAFLLVIGLANWGYAAYRMTNGKTDNLPLIIAGLTSLILALIIFKRPASKDE